MMELATHEWVMLMLAAFSLGLSKAGLKGMEMLNVTLMALVLGSKASTGVVLPLLCVSDVMAVSYYNRHAQWHHFKKLLPWIVAGIFLGVYAGDVMNEALFKKVMAIIIICIVIMMLWMELKKNIAPPTNRWFGRGTGLLVGITTMLGNLAGPVANIYFLALKIPKNEFIGTAAWIFLFINFFKLPLQAFSWNNIDSDSLLLDIWLLPALIVGFIAGIKLVSIIKDNHYRRFVLLFTVIGAVCMLLR